MNTSWSFQHIQLTQSTNDAARDLPAWSTLRATEQTLGRGRLGRHWFSREGGLWASYVLPLSDPNFPWTPLPLVAGLALLDLVKLYGIENARLRWPNDLLIGKSKLAGILVERSSPEKVIVGIGLNVTNMIADVADQLQDPPIRLADLMKTSPPNLDEIWATLAILLEKRFQVFCQKNLVGLADDFLQAWGKPQLVEIEVDKTTTRGMFIGIDNSGNPILEFENKTRRSMPGVHISRLREI